MSIAISLSPEIEALLREKADRQAEADSAFLLLSQMTSLVEKTREWYEGLLKAIESLNSW